MRTINFTAKEVLPALLDRSKTQTIRKAWEYKELRQVFPKGADNSHISIWDKPAKFNVGDKVELLWDEKEETNVLMPGKVTGQNVLGVVEVTEVFKTEICKNGIMIYKYGETDKTYYGHETCEELAKKDGFSSAQEMFECLDRIYDLSQPRKFWVYRWKWIGGVRNER